jgi:hypothetical protein
MAEFRELILSLLDLVCAETIVEIGGEDGTFTRELVARCKDRGGSVWCIDPKPSPALVSLCDAESAATLVQEMSVDALPHLKAADAYLIDGDHNHYTVTRELQAIWANAARDAPLVALHDVGWPLADRDLYYAPDKLPSVAVHPYTYDEGVTLDRSGVVAGGFRGEGAFALARSAGGPANGVRTAIDDFLAERDDLRLVVVPCVFGLGVMYPASARWTESLERLLAPYNANPLLERLERNRLALYLKVIELQDELNAVRSNVALGASGVDRPATR